MRTRLSGFGQNPENHLGEVVYVWISKILRLDRSRLHSLSNRSMHPLTQLLRFQARMHPVPGQQGAQIGSGFRVPFQNVGCFNAPLQAGSGTTRNAPSIIMPLLERLPLSMVVRSCRRGEGGLHQGSTIEHGTRHSCHCFHMLVCVHA